MDTAVILAAGMGIRIREYLGEIPKGMIKIDDQSILQRSINLLLEKGINKIYIVTGYQSEILKKYISELNLNCNIKFVLNPNYKNSGSMESLFILNDFIKSDFLLLESDLIYEEKALEVLLNNEKQDSILISGFTNSNDEVWVSGLNSFYNKHNFEIGRISKINKNLKKSKYICGELVGISWISLSLFKDMCIYHNKNHNKNILYHYEENISDLCVNNEIYYLKIIDLIWTEIDTINHYQNAIKNIWPKLEK